MKERQVYFLALMVTLAPHHSPFSANIMAFLILIAIIYFGVKED